MARDSSFGIVRIHMSVGYACVHGVVLKNGGDVRYEGTAGWFFSLHELFDERMASIVKEEDGTLV